MTIFRYRSARRGKSVDVDAPAAMATVFPGAPMCAWVQREFEELLAVLIVSPVGGNRWLPLTAFVERRQGQVPFYIYNESPTRMPRIILLDRDCRLMFSI